MARADVRIVWGIPSTLQADFILTNDTSAEITLETGFPVGAMRYTVDGNVNDGQDDTQAKPQMVKAESAQSRGGQTEPFTFCSWFMSFGL